MILTCCWLLLLVTECLNWWSLVHQLILQLMSGGFQALVKYIQLSKNFHGKRIGKRNNTTSVVLCKRMAENFQVLGLVVTKLKYKNL